MTGRVTRVRADIAIKKTRIADGGTTSLEINAHILSTTAENRLTVPKNI
jgi:hypothetical protein